MHKKWCEAELKGCTWGLSSINIERTHLTALHSTSMPAGQHVNAVCGKGMAIIACWWGVGVPWAKNSDVRQSSRGMEGFK